MKQYTFVLNFGYVEHAAMSYMPWTSREKYKDAKAALIDLAVFLKEQYMLKHEKKPKKCCLATKAKDASAEFCSKCGAELADAEFDSECFCDWLYDLSGQDSDGFHGEIDWEPNPKWQPGDLEGKSNQRFVYQAEWVLAAALGYPHDHRAGHTFEDICKKRTKSKKESFTYY